MDAAIQSYNINCGNTHRSGGCHDGILHFHFAGADKKSDVMESAATMKKELAKKQKQFQRKMDAM